MARKPLELRRFEGVNAGLEVAPWRSIRWREQCYPYDFGVRHPENACDTWVANNARAS